MLSIFASVMQLSLTIMPFFVLSKLFDKNNLGLLTRKKLSCLLSHKAETLLSFY